MAWPRELSGLLASSTSWVAGVRRERLQGAMEGLDGCLSGWWDAV